MMENEQIGRQANSTIILHLESILHENIEDAANRMAGHKGNGGIRSSISHSNCIQQATSVLARTACSLLRIHPPKLADCVPECLSRLPISCCFCFICGFVCAKVTQPTNQIPSIQFISYISPSPFCYPSLSSSFIQ